MSGHVNSRLLDRVCSACQRALRQTITCRICGNATCAHLIDAKTLTCFPCVNTAKRKQGTAA